MSDKAYQKRYHAEHWQNDPKYRKRVLEAGKAAKKRRRDFINSFKDIPCMDCGKVYPPCVMDFDHRDPAMKFMNVGAMATGWSQIKILEEIAKCDVVCANCHRIRTHLSR